MRQAIAHNQPNPADGLDVLAKVGGYDLVGMTGGDPRGGLLWPAGGAGWLPMPASALAPAAWPRRRTLILFLLHLSAEKGAQIALDALGLRPYLDMDMRLERAAARRAGDAPVGCRQRDVANQMGTLAQSNIVLPDSAPSS